MLAPAAGVLVATQVSPLAAMVALGVASVPGRRLLLRPEPADQERVGDRSRARRASTRRPAPWWRPPWLHDAAWCWSSSRRSAPSSSSAAPTSRSSPQLRDARRARARPRWCSSSGRSASLLGGLVFGAMRRPVSPCAAAPADGRAHRADRARAERLVAGPGDRARPASSARRCSARPRRPPAALSPDAGARRGDGLVRHGDDRRHGGRRAAGRAARPTSWAAGAGSPPSACVGAVLGGRRPVRRARWPITPARRPVPELEETAPGSRSVVVTGAMPRSDPSEWSARSQD